MEFLAYSGFRISEAQRIRWADIGEDFIEVLGAKSYRVRRVPILPAMQELLSRLTRHKGFLFPGPPPRKAIRKKCLDLGFEPMRIHDLRHLFATTCIEAGVDIPTVAKWLGHQDGGALAMRTYGHLRDDHSLAQAKRVLF